MKRWIWLLVVFAACGGDSSEPVAERPDDCYQESAQAYESAARKAETMLRQPYLEDIFQATSDLVEATRDPDPAAMRSAGFQIEAASDGLRFAGDQFFAELEDADALDCPE